ncbi:sugar kinase [Marinactinospora thermotolerans]|uniref:2-dehydro-3-deoxygluconokinase n=1 Tax=Marinactinospora thermotolerans DSM 45154 TaxID=1122192 RepID=A0A1T4N7F1_9ACTN|nr:sugar kinase [Marinactinospora thermotolerans]SJZ75154.1 2-dehydro-3-deoxygluconokinase [Marinactinospora thermotolerans DSM 45154]
MPSAVPPAATYDAVCLGETMALLAPISGAPLVERPALAMEIGGAESNVACGLAQFGRRTAWLSRVGDDPFGRIICAVLADHGVDVGAVEIDPDRPTGLYLKDPAPGGTRVHYYRRGSAASAMGPELAASPLLRGARLVHLSGITPALSSGCAELVERLMGDRDAGPLVSFDVNHRPALWPSRETAASALLAPARAADVVFVGRDEAQRLWGTATDDDVRALLPEVPCLVVKDAEHGATCYVGDERTFVPALSVDVVEPVGAGDAFAAGFLHGLLGDLPVRDRLRLGHIAAAVTLRSVGDVVTFPSAEVRARMLAADDGEWPYLRMPVPLVSGVAGTDNE